MGYRSGMEWFWWTGYESQSDPCFSKFSCGRLAKISRFSSKFHFSEDPRTVHQIKIKLLRGNFSCKSQTETLNTGN
ncbi:hypothetical protein BV898_12645 [Hypsibius exemplaris]|uniref:Uncharacterized protein n=1 Tax=Hypsibius exemplaris TaxID=2072580 RepID=A0A1W0WD04_HYPEX|nr:hypothetical protein BV898_12645 [Hypsibius exemplaris]